MAYTLGIDVSRWQDNNSTPQKMDWYKAARAGAKFTFIKSSQALGLDEDLLFNWKAAKDAGFLRGAYHFLTWFTDPIRQAQYAWSLIEKDPGEIRPVIDFEYWGSVPVNAEDLLWKYIVEMTRLCGKLPIIYTGAFFWQAQANQLDKWKQYPLWIASYSNQTYMEENVQKLTPWDTWSFWQFTDKGDGVSFGAESLQIDLNWYNGGEADLLKFCGIQEPTPLPEPEPETRTVEERLDELEQAVDFLENTARAKGWDV